MLWQMGKKIDLIGEASYATRDAVNLIKAVVIKQP
jgi:hypothetical protein